jgi:Lipopolysaccharide-assembly
VSESKAADVRMTVTGGQRVDASSRFLSVRTTVLPGSLGAMDDFLVRCSQRIDCRATGAGRAFLTGRGGIVLMIGSLLACLGGCGSFGRAPSARSSDGGFFGWHLNAPFDTSEVKTVSVYFRTQSFRRGVEQQLTEAVQKEIGMRTPYHVVGNHEKADSVLTGLITYADKNLVVEAPTNFARELNMTISVSVKWTHNPPNEVEDARLPTIVSEVTNFVPEVGETSLSATNHVVQNLAKQIVDMMEQPWFNNSDLN